MAWIQTLQSRFRMLRGLPVSAPLERNPLASSLSPGSRSNKGRGKGGTIAIVFFCLKAVILKRRGKDNGVLWKSTTSDSSQGWLSSPAAEAAGGSRGVLSSETAPSRSGTAALPLAHLLFLSSFLGKRTSESPTSPYTLPTLGTLASLPNGVNQRIQAEDKHGTETGHPLFKASGRTAAAKRKKGALAGHQGPIKMALETFRPLAKVRRAGNTKPPGRERTEPACRGARGRPNGALPGGLGTPAAAAISSPPAPHPLGSAPGPAALLGSEEPGRRHASPNRTRPLFPRRPPGSA
ncbi:uncharacterized protein LOC116661779 [Camelus ferus]|uniref:Uncharacterized protein LOC116661779 n=1 Tax=Camelus ferus TaxID=419612 RepID=A0A8B8SK35_CAMFR|nr:uncharacterized protein LOC116661779 [Camelus ferus]XP_032330216.1 uncharacterized protein LOC116661779 [Camelus ferus]